MQATEPSIETIAESLLQPQEVEETNPDEPVEDAAEAPVEEQTEVEDDAGEDLDEQPEGEEPEGTDEEDDEQEVSEEPAALHKVKVDGVEQEVTLEELTRGYAGQQYIQKGMAEAAEARKQSEAHLQALTTQGAQLSQLVQHLQENGLQAPTAPDVAMLQTDPIGYMEAKAAYDGDKAAYDQTLAQIQRQQAQVQAVNEQAQAIFVAEQREILERAIPEFSDPEKGREIQSKIRDAGMSYGFAEAEIAQVTDARHVQVLHDAMKYRELMANKETVVAKTAKARPVVKPGAIKPQNPQRKQMEKRQERFKKTGSLDDAVALIFDT